MNSVITYSCSCCLLLCIFAYSVAAHKNCSDQTPPSGYQLIAVGMGNQLCIKSAQSMNCSCLNLSSLRTTECSNEDLDEGSDSNHGNNKGSDSSHSRRRKRSDENHHERSESIGHYRSDDSCIHDVCCQGEMIHVLVNASCQCYPEETYTDTGPITVAYPTTTELELELEENVTTVEDITTTEATTTEATTTEATTTEATTTEATTTEAITTEETTTTEGTTTIEMTTAEATTTIDLGIISFVEGEFANPLAQRDGAVSKMDGMEELAFQSQRNEDESSDDSSDSEGDEGESESDITDNGSSGNYSSPEGGDNTRRGGSQVLMEGERCDGGSGNTDGDGDNGESGNDESDESRSESDDSSDSRVARACQEGLVCTPLGNGTSECRPATTTGPAVVTTTQIVIDPGIIARNMVPEVEQAAASIVNGTPGPTPAALSCLKLLLLLIFTFTIVLC